MSDDLSRKHQPGERTSSSLLEGIRLQDQESWNRLVSIYGPLVYEWCKRAGLQTADGADIVQEVFVAVARTVTKFVHDRERGSFRGWLRTITNHKVLDLYRTIQKSAIGTGGSDAQAFISQLPAYENEQPAYTAHDDQIVLDRVLALLKCEFQTTTWNAFWRTVVDGVCPADVAAELSISRNAVYVAKSRVLQRLRQELDGLNDPVLGEQM